MNASYIVHSLRETSTTMPATLPDGSTADVPVPCVMVELVSPIQGTVALYFAGAAAASAREKFTPGRAITATFEGA
jgi:ribosomal protein S12 methylthiotransferase accessory factor YcaO